MNIKLVFLPKSQVGHQLAASLIGINVHLHRNRKKKECVYGLLFPLHAAQEVSILLNPYNNPIERLTRQF